MFTFSEKLLSIGWVHLLIIAGGQEIMMFCDKVKKDDIEIRFVRNLDGEWPNSLFQDYLGPL